MAGHRQWQSHGYLPPSLAPRRSPASSGADDNVGLAQSSSRHGLSTGGGTAVAAASNLSFAAQAWADCLVSTLEDNGGELRFRDFAPAYRRKVGRRFIPRDHGRDSLDELVAIVPDVQVFGNAEHRAMRLTTFGRLTGPLAGAENAAVYSSHAAPLDHHNARDMSELNTLLFDLLRANPGGKSYNEVVALWRREYGEDISTSLAAHGIIPDLNGFKAAVAPVTRFERGYFFPKFKAQQVKAQLELAQDILITRNSHFDHGDIIVSLCKQLKVTKFQDLGFGHPWQLEPLKNIIELEQRISTYIDAYMATHPICALYDLQECILAKETEKKPSIRRYSDLRLGPLLRHPKVITAFDPPAGMTAIPKVTSEELVDCFRNFMMSNFRGSSKSKIQPFQIAEALAETRGVKDPGELCVCITKHIGYHITMIGKMKNRARDQQTNLEDRLSKELNSKVKAEKDKLMIQHQKDLQADLSQLQAAAMLLKPLSHPDSDLLLNPSIGNGVRGRLLWDLAKLPEDCELDGSPIQLRLPCRNCVDVLVWHARQTLATVQVNGSEDLPNFVNTILKRPPELLDLAVKGGSGWSKGQEKKLVAAECLLIEFFSKDLLGRALMQLLIKSGKQTAGDSLTCGKESSALDGDPEAKRKAASAAAEDHVHTALANQLRSLTAGEGLSALADVEHSVSAGFGAQSFSELGHGSLLEFLASSPALMEQAQRAAGRGAGACDARPALITPEQVAAQVLLSVPADASPSYKESLVCDVLRSHYCVKDPRDLPMNCGTSELVKSLEAGAGGAAAGPPVVYAAAALGASLLEQGAERRGAGGGTLGAVGKEEAARCLAAAPMLCDLLDWSHWNGVFEPTLGPLLPFLETIAAEDPSAFASISMRVLATADSRLLKLPLNSSPELFAAEVKDGAPARAAAQLLSIIAGAGSLDLSPRSRLVLEANSGLAALSLTSQDTMVTFWLECLCLLPNELRNPVAEAVLLPAISEVMGKKHGHQVLLEAAKKTPLHCKALAVLGLHVGEDTWTQSWAQAWQNGTQDESSKQAQGKTAGQRRSAAASGSLQSQTTGQVPSWLSPSLQEPAQDPGSDGTSTELQNNFGNNQQNITDQGSPGDASDPLHSAEGLVGLNSQAAEEAEEFIAQIRSDRSLQIEEDTALSADSLRRLEENRRRTGKLCDKLSKELYSEDNHFVLELVQNADDNNYQEPRPALRFIVSRSSITVLNNEVGFSRENIAALCDMGGSTKESKVGFIGQKGIGFRSVFRVTNKPSVHSSGYHIAFDLSAPEGKLNYIMPTWVGPEYLAATPVAQESSEVAEELQTGQWRTIIHLPKKQSGNNEGSTRSGIDDDAVSFQFSDIDPSMLLFLRKLRHISIWDVENQCRREMWREERHSGIVQIHSSDDGDLTHSYLVVKRILEPGVKRRDVEISLTEICAAVELGQSGSTTPCNVFAFLPVRSYGFRFILQGDFLVSSSRESIDRNDAWNQRLFEEVPRLFVDVFEACKNLSSTPSEDVEAAKLWLRAVPLEGEIYDVFRPSVQAIHRALQGMPCVLAEDGAWIQPCYALLATSASICELLQASELWSGMGVSAVHPELLPFAPALKAIGVKELGWEQLLGLIEHKLLKSSGILNVPWLAKVLACLYLCLSEGRLPQTAISKLRKLPIIPVQDGGFVACDLVHVYFPLRTGTGGSEETAAGKSLASAVETAKLDLGRHVKLLQLDLVKEIKRSGTPVGITEDSQVLNFLKHVGVQKLTKRSLVELHLLPSLVRCDKEEGKTPTGDSSTCFDETQLIGMLGLVRLHCANLPSAEQESIVERLRGGLYVATSQGVVCLGDTDAASHIKITSSYGSQLLPESLFHTLKWPTISAAYQSCNGQPSDWLAFFSRLGLQELGEHEEVMLQVTPQLKEEKGWAEVQWGDLPPCGYYTVRDWRCRELEQLLSAQLTGRDLQALASYLDRNWERLFQGHTEVEPLDPGSSMLLQPDAAAAAAAGLTWLQPASSSLLTALRTNAWLTSDTGKLYCPGQLFLLSQPMVRHALGRLRGHVPFLDETVKLHSKRFREAIGLERYWSTDELLGALRCCAADPTFNKETGTLLPVYTSLGDIIRNDQYAALKVQEAMMRERLLYIPGQQPAKNGARREGEQQAPASWYSLQNVRLRDTSGVVEEIGFDETGLRIMGKKGRGKDAPHTKFYEQDALDDFFLALSFQPSSAYLEPQASIAPRFPTPEEYRKVLAAIAAQSATVTSNQLNLVTKVFTMWAEGINRFLKMGKGLSPDEVASWLPMIRELKIFPTTKSTWCSLSEGVYINDDTNISDDFEEAAVKASDKEIKHAVRSLNFLHVPANDARSQRSKQRRFEYYPDTTIMPFLEALRVPLLSKSVVTKPVYDHYFFNRSISNTVADMVPCVQRWLFDNRGREKYLELEDFLSSQERGISDFKCIVLQRVEARLSLLGSTMPPVHVEKPVSMDISGMQLSVAASHEKEYRVIFTELSRLFNFGSVDRDLASYLVTMAYEGVQNSEEHLAAEFGLLDEDIQRWEVKKIALAVGSAAPMDGDDDEEEDKEGAFGNAEVHRSKAKKHNDADDEPVASWPPPRPVANNSNNLRPREVALAGPQTPLKESSLSAHAQPEVDLFPELTMIPPEGSRKHQESTTGNRESHAAPPEGTTDTSIECHQTVGDHGSHGNRLRSSEKQHHSATDTGGTGISSPTTPAAPVEGGADGAYPEGHVPFRPAQGGFSTGSSSGAGIVFEGPVEFTTEELQAYPIAELKGVKGAEDLLSVVAGLGDTAHTEVGRHGEELVYKWLCRSMGNAQEGMIIDWVNMDGESGKPYDLTITAAVPSVAAQDGKESITQYIEVKTSRSSDKVPFEVSIPELKFAEQQGPMYSIYRLTGVGAGNTPMMMKIQDPAMHIRAGSMTVLCAVQDLQRAGSSVATSDI